MWFVFALLSAIFAALTSILAKVGIEGVNSNLATAIRTVVVVVMAWGMVFLTNAQNGIAEISKTYDKEYKDLCPMLYMMADDETSTGETETPKQQAANDARENFLDDMNQIFEQILQDKMQKRQTIEVYPCKLTY